MNKSTLITAIVIIGCIVTLFASYNIYQSRIQDVNESTETETAPVKALTKDKQIKKEAKFTTKEKVQTNSDSLSDNQISTLTANMSDEASAVFTTRLESGEKIQLLVIGSSSIEDGNPGYGELLTTNLSEAYGDWIETTILPYSGTIADLSTDIDGKLVNWSNDFDVVLLEGMNIENNGQVVVEDSIDHVEIINNQMKQNVSDSVLLVHPSQPLAKAVFYPKEVESFKSYLTARDYTYIDHWAKWPVGNEEEMNTYLTEDGEPNDKGAALWASALSTFFIGK